MAIDQTATTLDRFFNQAAASPQRALLLDYDGTLAPFQVDRDRAWPYPGVRELLTALMVAGRTRIVIVSGRSVSDLVRLLAIDPLPELWGSHGWEHQLADGTYLPPQFNEAAQAGLKAAQEVARAQGLAQAFEYKPSGIALHWRGRPAAEAAALRTSVGGRWEAIAQRYGLTLHAFDGGIELRVVGRDKGSAVQSVLDELDPASALAYLGDDMTDEDAFRTIGVRGLCILVRGEQRPSAAQLWLRPPAELLSFLSRWVELDTAQR